MAALDLKTYSRNVLRSVGYIGTKTIKELNPTIAEFSDMNGGYLKDAFAAVKNARGGFTSLRDTIAESEYTKVATDTVRNFFDDLKTGNFYNPERESQTAGDALGIDMDEFDDWSTDDSDEGPSVSSSSSSSSSNELDKNSMDFIGRKIAESSGRSTFAAADYVVKTNRASTRGMMKHSEMLANRLNMSLYGINNTIAAVGKGLVEPANVHFNNSTKFYEQQTQESAKQTKLLEEIHNMLQQRFAPAQKNSFGNNNESAFSRVMGFSGMPDLLQYGKEMMASLTETVGFIKDFKDLFTPEIMRAMAASPVASLASMGLTGLGNVLFGKSLKNFNSVLKGTLTSLVARGDKARHNDTGGLLNAVLRLFNLDVNTKKTIDVGNYEKGRVDWDGKSRKALMEVIPTQLGNILAAITGQEVQVFNYETGKWTTKASLKKEMLKKINGIVANNTSDFQNRMMELYTENQVKRTNRSETAVKSSPEYHSLQTDMKAFMEWLRINRRYVPLSNKEWDQLDQYMTKLRLIARDEKSPGIILRKNFSKIRRLYQQNSRTNQSGINTQLAGNLYAAQDEIGRMYGNLERDPGAYASLYNNSDNAGNIDVNKVSRKHPFNLVVDNKGKNLFFYLQAYYKSFDYILRNWNNGGSGSPTPGPIGPDMVRNGYLYVPSDIARNNLNAGLPSLDENTPSSGSSNNSTTSNNKGRRKKGPKGGTRLQNQGTYGQRINDKEYKKYLAQLDRDKQILKSKGRGLSDKDYARYKEFTKDKRNEVEDYFDRTFGGIKGKFLGKLLSAPIVHINNMIDSATNNIYKLFFGDGLNGKSLFQAITDGFENTFRKIGDKIHDFFDKNILPKIKGFGAGILRFFHIDPESLKNGIVNSKFGQQVKQGFSNAGNWVKHAFTDTFHRGKNFFTRHSDADKYNFEGNTAARGGIVRKPGMVSVSEGELIIPGDMNPYYHGPYNRELNSIREQAVASQYYANGGKGKYFGNFAKGGTATANAKEMPTQSLLKKYENYRARARKAGEVVLGVEEWYNKYKDYQAKKSQKADIRREAIRQSPLGHLAARKLKKLKGYKDRTIEEINKLKEKAQYDKAYNAAMEAGIDTMQTANTGFTNFMAALFGKTTDEKGNPLSTYEIRKQMGKKLQSAGKEVKENAGFMAAGGAIGGLTSAALGLVGGPLLGAGIGSAIALAQHSEKFQDVLFGEREDPKDPNSARKGGIFGPKLSNFLEKNFPDLAKGGFAGGVLAKIGLIPGGPIAGIMIGSAISGAMKSESFHNYLFGDFGLFGKDADKKIVAKLKSSAKNMGIGAALTGLLHPIPGLGLVGNVVLGAGLGLVSDTEMFKNFLFGHKDSRGNRTGGLLGSLRKRIVEPLTGYLKEGRLRIENWFIGNFVEPTKNLLGAIGDRIKGKVDSIGDFFKKQVSTKIIEPIGSWMERNLFGGITKLIGGLGKKLINFGGFVTGGFYKNTVNAVANKMNATNIRRGYSSLSLADRVALNKRAQGGGLLGVPRLALGRKFHTQDYNEAALNMSSEELQQYLDQISAYKNANKENARIRSESGNELFATLKADTDDTKTGFFKYNGYMKRLKTAIDKATNETGDYKEVEKIMAEMKKAGVVKKGIGKTSIQKSINAAKTKLGEQTTIDAQLYETGNKAANALGFKGVEHMKDRDLRLIIRDIASKKNAENEAARKGETVEEQHPEQKSLFIVKDIADKIPKAVDETKQAISNGFDIVKGIRDALYKKWKMAIPKAKPDATGRSDQAGENIIDKAGQIFGGKNKPEENAPGTAAKGGLVTRSGLVSLSKGEGILSNLAALLGGRKNTPAPPVATKSSARFRAPSYVPKGYKNIWKNTFNSFFNSGMTVEEATEYTNNNLGLDPNGKKNDDGSIDIVQLDPNGNPVTIRKDANGNTMIDPRDAGNKKALDEKAKKDKDQKKFFGLFNSIGGFIGGLKDKFFGDDKKKNKKDKEKKGILETLGGIVKKPFELLGSAATTLSDIIGGDGLGGIFKSLLLGGATLFAWDKVSQFLDSSEEGKAFKQNVINTGVNIANKLSDWFTSEPVQTALTNMLSTAIGGLSTLIGNLLPKNTEEWFKFFTGQFHVAGELTDTAERIITGKHTREYGQEGDVKADLNHDGIIGDNELVHTKDRESESLSHRFLRVGIGRNTLLLGQGKQLANIVKHVPVVGKTAAAAAKIGDAGRKLAIYGGKKLSGTKAGQLVAGAGKSVVNRFTGSKAAKAVTNTISNIGQNISDARTWHSAYKSAMGWMNGSVNDAIDIANGAIGNEKVASKMSNAATKVASVSDKFMKTSVGKNTSKIFGRIKSAVASVFHKIAGLLGTKADDAVEAAVQNSAGDIAEAAAQNGAKKGFGNLLKMSPLAIAFIIAAVEDGWEDARAILGITNDPSIGERAIAAAVNGINNAIPGIGGIIPTEYIVNVAMMFMKAIGHYPKEFDADRQAAEQELAEYNAANPEHTYNMREYIENVLGYTSTQTKIRNAVGGAVKGTVSAAKKVFTKSGRAELAAGAKKTFGNLKESAGKAWNGAKSAVSKFGSGVVSGAKNAVNSVKQFGSNVIGGIKEGVIPYIDKAKDFIEKFSNSTFVQDMTSGVKDIFGFVTKGDIGGLFKYFIPGIDWKNNPIMSLPRAVVSIGSKIGLLVPTTVSWLGHRIADVITGIIDTGKNVFNTIEPIRQEYLTLQSQGDISGVWNHEIETDEGGFGWLAKIANVVYKFGAIPGTFAVNIGHKVADGIKSIFGTVSDAAGTLASVQKEMLDITMSGDVNALNAYQTPENSGGFFGGLLDAEVGILKIPYTYVAHAVEIKNNIVKGIDVIKDKVTNAIFDAKGLISDLWDFANTNTHKDFDEGEWKSTVEKYKTEDGGPSNALAGIISGIMHPFVQIRRVIGWLGDKVDAAKEKADEFVDNAKDKVNDVKEGASNLWNGAKNTVTGWINAAADLGFGSGMHTVQNDPRYGNMSYGGSTLGENGCAPAAATTILNRYGRGANIKDSAAYAVYKGYAAGSSGMGTQAAYFGDYLGANGISTNYTNSRSAIEHGLRAGKPTVLLGQNRGNGSKANSPFGPKPHYVVAEGMDSKGHVLVDDSELNAPAIYNKNILNQSKLGIMTGGDSDLVDGDSWLSGNKMSGSVAGSLNGSIGALRQSEYSNPDTLKAGNTSSDGKTTTTGLMGKDFVTQIWNYFTRTMGLSKEAAAGIIANIRAESVTFNPGQVEYSFRKKLNELGNPYMPAGVDARNKHEMFAQQYIDAIDRGMKSGANDKSSISEYEFEHPVSEGSIFKYWNNGKRLHQYGYGLAGFTSPDIKKQIYDMAKNSNRSVADMEVQLIALTDQLKKAGVWSKIQGNITPESAAEIMLRDYERPSDIAGNVPKRRDYAREYYNKLKDSNDTTPVTTTGGSINASNLPSGTSSSSGSSSSGGLLSKITSVGQAITSALGQAAKAILGATPFGQKLISIFGLGDDSSSSSTGTTDSTGSFSSGSLYASDMSGTIQAPATANSTGTALPVQGVSPSNDPRLNLINAARSQLGVREGHDNITDYGQFTGANRAPWCASFVSWAADQSVQGDVNKRNIVLSGPKTAAVSGLVSNFKSQNRLVHDPQPGDIVLWKSGSRSHTGIVEAINSNNTITTIEGNSDNRVKENTYDMPKFNAGLAGLGRPDWAKVGTLGTLNTGSTSGNAPAVSYSGDDTWKGTGSGLPHIIDFTKAKAARAGKSGLFVHNLDQFYGGASDIVGDGKTINYSAGVGALRKSEYANQSVGIMKNAVANQVNNVARSVSNSAGSSTGFDSSTAATIVQLLTIIANNTNNNANLPAILEILKSIVAVMGKVNANSSAQSQDDQYEAQQDMQNIMGKLTSLAAAM